MATWSAVLETVQANPSNDESVYITAVWTNDADARTFTKTYQLYKDNFSGLAAVRAMFDAEAASYANSDGLRAILVARIGQEITTP